MDIKPEQNLEQLILETAETLFLEKGFAATSTTQIARAVGCNQALVHYYYRTKENLFNTIFEQKFKVFFNLAFDINMSDTLSFTEKIKRFIETHFDMLASNPKIPMLVLHEFSRQPIQIKLLISKLERLPEKLLNTIQEELQHEIELGSIRNIDFLDLLISIVTLNVSVFTTLPLAEEFLKLTDIQKK